jgi:hypothetical protein
MGKDTSLKPLHPYNVKGLPIMNISLLIMVLQIEPTILFNIVLNQTKGFFIFKIKIINESYEEEIKDLH